MENSEKNMRKISDELLAAFLDGNVSVAETEQVLQAMQADPQVGETLKIALNLQEDESTYFDKSILPVMHTAAESDTNLCCVYCETYILGKHGIDYDEAALIEIARENGWLTDKGTPLHAVGQLLALEKLIVSRVYDATLNDISEALANGGDVIVVVDSEKLYPDLPDEEDAPNHALVVTAIDREAGCVTVYNALEQASGDLQQVNLDDFRNAWRESHNYMVRTLRSLSEYRPRPVDIAHISLTEDLIDLREAIAENAHEVWAATRIKEGWTYGPVRDDVKKQHPDLVPYSVLPDSEKEYDRLMAMNTIKLVKRLGFEIVRNNNIKSERI